jgi:hypothetical protein
MKELIKLPRSKFTEEDFEKYILSDEEMDYLRFLEEENLLLRDWYDDDPGHFCTFNKKRITTQTDICPCCKRKIER